MEVVRQHLRDRTYIVWDRVAAFLSFSLVLFRFTIFRLGSQRVSWFVLLRIAAVQNNFSAATCSLLGHRLIAVESQCPLCKACGPYGPSLERGSCAISA